MPAKKQSPKDNDSKATREKEALLFTEEDDGGDLENEISTETHYVSVPVGRSITGVFVELRPINSKIDQKLQMRPVLLVGDQTVILPGHTQLVTACGKIKPGTQVKIACIEKVELDKGRTAWNYRISAAGLPF